MASIEWWMTWIVQQLFSEGVYNYVLEETLRGKAGHHIDANFDIALQRLMDEGVVQLLESEGKRHYGVPIVIDKLKRARQIANDTPTINTPVEPKIVQDYLPDPEGFEYWFSPPDDRSRTRKKSIYDYYRGKTDKETYLARIMSQSDAEPKIIRTGSMKNPTSYAARGWAIFNELAAVSPDGTVSLMELIKRDTDVFGSNKRRGKVLLAIYEKEGWIVKDGKRGKDVRYRLSGSAPPEPKQTNASLEAFMEREPERQPDLSDFNDGGFNESEIAARDTKRDGSSSSDRKE